MPNSKEIETILKLQDAVKGFSDELKTLLAGLGHADSELDKAAKSAEAYAKKLGGGLTAIAMQAGAAAWKTASDYEQAVKSIQISTGATGRQLQALEKQFRSVMNEVPNSTGEVAGVIAHLDNLTNASGDVMHALTRQILDLSRMLKEDAAGNAEAFGNVLALWQRPAEDAGAILDGMFKISQDAGIGFGKLASDLNSYGAGMQLAGFSIEETADLFGRLHAQGITVSKVMPGLNKSFQQWAGEQKDSRQELAKTIQAMRDAETSTDALTVATEVFGKESAEQLVATVRNGSLALDGLAGSFEGASGSIARYADETMTIDEKMQRLKNQLFQVLEPYGEKMIEQAEKAVKYFDENGPQMIAIAEDVAKALAGIAIAAGTIKVGKGIMDATAFIGNLTKIGKAAATTGAGVGGVSTSVRVLSLALRALSGPVGWTLTGVGLLSAGWSAYKKHQENARQELLHMGESLNDAFNNYDSVKEHSKRTNELINEYDRLKDKIANTATPAEELTEARRKLAVVEQELIDMNPDILRAEDAKSEKFREVLGDTQKRNEIVLEMERRKLENTIINSTHKMPDLLTEYDRLNDEAAKYDKSYIEARESYFQYLDYHNRKQAISHNRNLTESERNEQLAALAAEIYEETGNKYEGLWGNLEVHTNRFLDSFNEQYGKWEETRKEIALAEETFQTYYDSLVQKIEADLGGSIDELTQNYHNLSEEEKKLFNDRIAQLSEWNTQFNMLPPSKTIDIKAIWRQTGVIPDDPSIPLSARYSMHGFADGGFSDRPAIFGEAGLEAAIPINNKPRSHAILDRVNQLMGHDAGSNVQITFAPNIRLAVGGSEQDVRGQVQSAIRESQAEFERRFRDMLRQERRLSFHV
ncbi:phage tail tape measure protein [Xylanibacillus composti]|uniref:Phage tail tape measure protein domain-containing protein n=1 Tax=Xylanibacillus composti TaxID=1572762 RepID=A0A8J4H428_9BACL|nr:phage tail tape measure protein [Xylanibacillus composti]GIQ69265.1 hypothetical protein XYCOK13_20890 [Xylanibacillus composti]